MRGALEGLNTAAAEDEALGAALAFPGFSLHDRNMHSIACFMTILRQICLQLSRSSCSGLVSPVMMHSQLAAPQIGGFVPVHVCMMQKHRRLQRTKQSRLVERGQKRHQVQPRAQTISRGLALCSGWQILKHRRPGCRWISHCIALIAACSLWQALISRCVELVEHMAEGSCLPLPNDPHGLEAYSYDVAESI